MDYCHHCQRHLNGALACAGCGTPAEELRLHDPAPYEAEVVLATREHSQEPVRGPRRQRGSRKRKVSRRERREMRAERGVHRRRGRAVLLTVMGLVLAVGALSLAELALESSGDNGDATSVQEDRAIELDGGPPPSGPKKPEDPGPVTGTPSKSMRLRATRRGRLARSLGVGNGRGIRVDRRRGASGTDRLGRAERRPGPRRLARPHGLHRPHRSAERAEPAAPAVIEAHAFSDSDSYRGRLRPDLLLLLRAGGRSLPVTARRRPAASAAADPAAPSARPPRDPPAVRARSSARPAAAAPCSAPAPWAPPA